MPTSLIVPTVLINGGAPAYTDCNGASVSLVGQNSVIEQIQVTFNEPVQLDPNAFIITSLAKAVTVDAGPYPNSMPVTAIQTPVDAAGTQWIVTFSGPGTNPINGGTGAIIKDGLYVLTTIGSKVHAQSGGDKAADKNLVFWALDGSEGNIANAASAVVVNNTDFKLFNATFGSNANLIGPGYTPYNPAFDFNLDGVVDSTDYAIFKAHFNADWFLPTITASNASLSVVHDTVLPIDLSQYVSDSWGGQPQFNLGTPSNGQLTQNTDGTFNYTPPAGWTGTDSFTFTAVDGIAETNSATVTIGVTETVTMTSPGNESDFAGALVSLDISATDTAGNALAYSANGTLPPGLSIDPNTGSISGTLGLHAGSATPYVVYITATDPTTGVNAQCSFNWTVSQPVVTLQNPGNLSNYVGEAVSSGAIASDSADDPLSYSIQNLPPGLTFDQASGNISGVIAAGANTGSPYTVTATATDTVTGDYATQQFSWATPVAYYPVANDAAFVIDDSGYLNVSASKGVLANTFNPMNSPLSATLVTGIPAGVGTLNFQSDGTFSFTEGPNWTGAVKFGYSLDQGDPNAGTKWVFVQDRITTASSIHLRTVNFYDTNARIKTDTTNDVYGRNQWQDNNGNGLIDGNNVGTDGGDHQYPVSYTRGSTISVRPEFIIDASAVPFWRGIYGGGDSRLDSANVLVRASGPDGLTVGSGNTPRTLRFLSGLVSGIPPIGTTTVAALTPEPAISLPFDQALPNSTAYYSAFTLNWQISTGGANGPWVTPTVGSTSSNEMFVTWQNPQVGSGANAGANAGGPGNTVRLDQRPAIRQTVFYAGIWGSIGATTQAQLVSFVFSGFQSRTITRADGTPMKYYGDWQAAFPISTTDPLIQTANGGCYAWAKLFVDALRAEGANVAYTDGRTIQAKQGTYDFFLVNSWQFNANQAAPAVPLNAGFTNYNDLPAGANREQFQLQNGSWQYVWGANEGVTSPQNGNNAPGQNQPNPASIFNNHGVVEIGGTWYDPSYGLTYDNNLASFESAAISGYGKYELVVATNSWRADFTRPGTAATVGNRLQVSNGMP